MAEHWSSSSTPSEKLRRAHIHQQQRFSSQQSDRMWFWKEWVSYSGNKSTDLLVSVTLADTRRRDTVKRLVLYLRSILFGRCVNRRREQKRQDTRNFTNILPHVRKRSPITQRQSETTKGAHAFAGQPSIGHDALPESWICCRSRRLCTGRVCCLRGTTRVVRATFANRNSSPAPCSLATGRRNYRLRFACWCALPETHAWFPHNEYKWNFPFFFFFIARGRGVAIATPWKTTMLRRNYISPKRIPGSHTKVLQ